MRTSAVIMVGGYLIGLSVSIDEAAAQSVYDFTPEEVTFLQTFGIDRLPELPPDPTNRYADQPEAAQFGHTLFFDRRLSANSEVSCAHCHNPAKFFTDGLARAQAIGTTRRSTPSLMGIAFSPWFYWDGRKDSLWSQSLEPIENPTEHGLTRVELVARIAQYHRAPYTALFGALPNFENERRFPRDATPRGSKVAQHRWQKMRPADRHAVNQVFANFGKVIMAYERQLLPTASRFDRFVSALGKETSKKQLRRLYEEDEIIGLRLFMGRAQCASCHNGPLFTNFEFHNIGAPEPTITQVDLGRAEGVLKVKDDEFNCLSRYSDASADQCHELMFIKTEGMELIGAFKTPSLRNIAETAPYMQSGQLATLTDVVQHYNTPKPPYFDPKQHTARPHFDIMPLGLSPQEIEQLVAFLKTLTSMESSPWQRSPSG